jgi:hypothetical protein
MTGQARRHASPEIPLKLSGPVEQVLTLTEQHLEAGTIPGDRNGSGR